MSAERARDVMLSDFLVIQLHHGYTPPKNKKANPEELAYLIDSIGAAGRNRTGDLRITNALLYQLSYSGKRERAF